MELVDLVGRRLGLKITLVMMQPCADPLPKSEGQEWVYLARGISKEEAQHKLNTEYASITQPKC